MLDSALVHLFHWINEREQIRIKKETCLPKPWTNDVILRSYRFCNVRREHDKVTKWIRSNWGLGHAAHSNFTLAMAMARFINLPDTLQDVGFPYEWNAEEVASKLHAREYSGNKVWNSAYIVSTNGRKMGKIDYVVNLVLEPLSRRKIEEFEDCEEAFNFLIQTQGVGSFMAGQIIADMKNTPGHPLADAPDFDSFVVSGPGSKRGVNRILGRNIHIRSTEETFRQTVLTLQKKIDDELEMALDAQDVQNCLCEFDKYMRAKNGEGRPKQHYPGGSDG